MERAETLWVKNGRYGGLEEFHFRHPEMSFVAYFKDGGLIFVIDGTNDAVSPNDLLVIEPLPGETDRLSPKVKWDAILKEKFGMNPLHIRPKSDTKYRKLDVSYSSLDMYSAFVSFPTEAQFRVLKEGREVMALENAYQREAADLLVYNKASQTMEKAGATLEAMKKRVLSVSKRLKKLEDAEAKNPARADEVKKAGITQKLYAATEKMKRTERRIKRAKKRVEAAYSDLSAKRAQIRGIKGMLEARGRVLDELDRENTKANERYAAASRDASGWRSVPAAAPAGDGKTERLTIAAADAKNRAREEQDSIKESIMAKDNEKPAQEFKPPFVDDTADSKGSDIRFAKKGGVSLDDRNRKIWMYSASVLVSLLLVFVIFYLVSSDGGADESYTRSYVEQTYVEPEPEPGPAQPEPVYVPEPVAYEEPVPVVEARRPAPKAAAPAKSARPVYSKPVVERKSVAAPRPAPRPAPAPLELRHDDRAIADIGTIDAARKAYVDAVLADNRYVVLISSVKFSFFNDDDNGVLEKLEAMNAAWNRFRNAVYVAYYENDYVLKADIDYEDYAEDERLLRLYADVYQEFFEYITNEFAMTYEYANSTASDMYEPIEEELQVLGRQDAKLNLLVELYNIVQMQGGTVDLLEAIYVRDNEAAEVPAPDNGQGGVILLDAETEVLVKENLSGDEQKYNLIETMDYAIDDNVAPAPESIGEESMDDSGMASSGDSDDYYSDDGSVAEDDPAAYYGDEGYMEVSYSNY